MRRPLFPRAFALTLALTLALSHSLARSLALALVRFGLEGSLLPELFSRDELLDVVRRHRAEFEQLLRPHLAPTEPADTLEDTLSSPQLRQAVGQLAAALNSPNAEQIFAELNLHPQTAGVLGFIEAVQQQADATVRVLARSPDLSLVS